MEMHKGHTTLAAVAAVLMITANVQGNPVFTFQRGVDDYYDTVDTYLQNNDPSSHGSEPEVFVLDDLNTGVIQHGLLRFDNVFGPTGVPLGSGIVSATLTVRVIDASGHGADADVYMHRMLGTWSDSDTWDDWGDGIPPHNGIGGIQTPDEAVSPPDVTIPGPIPAGTRSIDVTNSVQAWSDGASNHGWVFFIEPLNEQWSFASSDWPSPSLRPQLSVTIPEPTTVLLFALGSLSLLRRRR